MSITSTVVGSDAKPTQLLHPPVVGQAAPVQRLEDVVGDRRPGEPGDDLAMRQSGPMSGNGMRPPRRIACSAVIAPLAEHVDRLVEPALGGGDEGPGALDVLDDAEGRVGEHAERDDRHAQQPTERARHVRTEHAAEAHGGDRHADAPADVAGGALDLGERAPEVARRGDRRPTRRGVSAAPRARP